ncbi:MAG TPA: hypothetical protein VGX97_05030 [bacterium]|nr:hypothetical protein [bacterium]
MPARTHRLSPWRRAAVAACLAAAIGLGSAAGAARAAPVYPLYYALEIPPVLTGYEMDEQKDKHLIYTSLLRGTLGGLAIEAATVTLRPGASANAGGGEFSLRTAAGTVKSGLVLMTSDARRTTLLFLGTYLGARLEFRMAGPAADFGSATIATKGLALTNFAAHSEYLAAVTQAVANLAPAPRALAITEADGNPRLVAAFQGTASP